jgi:hypothetical protein
MCFRLKKSLKQQIKIGKITAQKQKTHFYLIHSQTTAVLHFIIIFFSKLYIYFYN